MARPLMHRTFLLAKADKAEESGGTLPNQKGQALQSVPEAEVARFAH